MGKGRGKEKSKVTREQGDWPGRVGVWDICTLGDERFSWSPGVEMCDWVLGSIETQQESGSPHERVTSARLAAVD